MSTLMVTGATGLLGSHVVECALGQGWAVRALVRRPDEAGYLERLGAKLIRGDLTHASAVREAFRGCDAVVHAAAEIGTGGNPRRFEAGNVLATEHVIDAAGRGRCRLVHVSSTAVVGSVRYRAEGYVDEAVALPELPAWDAYGRTKQAAEASVLEAARGGRLWGTVVRPPLMYGRRDRQLAPRLGPVVRALTRWGRIPSVGRGETLLPLVHARSVAEGILGALGHGCARGRVYHLTQDQPVSVRTLFEAAARGVRGPCRPLVVSPRLARVGFRGLTVLFTALGRGDLAGHAEGTYRTLTGSNPFCCARAREELGWRPQLDPGAEIEDAFRWWAARSARRRRLPTHPEVP